MAHPKSYTLRNLEVLCYTSIDSSQFHRPFLFQHCECHARIEVFRDDRIVATIRQLPQGPKLFRATSDYFELKGSDGKTFDFDMVESLVTVLHFVDIAIHNDTVLGREDRSLTTARRADQWFSCGREVLNRAALLRKDAYVRFVTMCAEETASRGSGFQAVPYLHPSGTRRMILLIVNDIMVATIEFADATVVLDTTTQKTFTYPPLHKSELILEAILARLPKEFAPKSTTTTSNAVKKPEAAGLPDEKHTATANAVKKPEAAGLPNEKHTATAAAAAPVSPAAAPAPLYWTYADSAEATVTTRTRVRTRRPQRYVLPPWCD